MNFSVAFTQSYTPSFFNCYTSSEKKETYAFIQSGFEKSSQITVVGNLVKSKLSAVGHVFFELQGEVLAQRVQGDLGVRL